MSLKSEWSCDKSAQNKNKIKNCRAGLELELMDRWLIVVCYLLWSHASDRSLDGKGIVPSSHRCKHHQKLWREVNYEGMWLYIYLFIIMYTNMICNKHCNIPQFWVHGDKGDVVGYFGFIIGLLEVMLWGMKMKRSYINQFVSNLTRHLVKQPLLKSLAFWLNVTVRTLI